MECVNGTVDLKGSRIIDMEIAASVIDDAVKAGADIRLLRWRVSAAQGHAMVNWALMISFNPSPPLYWVETGAMYTHGNFCGIPFVVDRQMPQDTIILERLEPTPTTIVCGLMVPQSFFKK